MPELPIIECIHQTDVVCIQDKCPMWKNCVLDWRPEGWEDAHSVLIRETGSKSMDSAAMYELGASNMLKALRQDGLINVGLSDKYRITM